MSFIRVTAVVDGKDEQQLVNLKRVRRFTPANEELQSPIISISQNAHPGALSIVWFDNSEVLWVKETMDAIEMRIDATKSKE